MTTLCIRIERVSCFSGGFFLKKHPNGHVSVTNGQGTPLSLSYLFGADAERMRPILERCQSAADLVSLATNRGCQGIEIISDVDPKTPVENALDDLMPKLKPYLSGDDLSLPIPEVLRLIASRMEDDVPRSKRRRKLDAV